MKLLTALLFTIAASLGAADDPTLEPSDSAVTVLTYDNFYRFVEQVSLRFFTMPTSTQEHYRQMTYTSH